MVADAEWQVWWSSTQLRALDLYPNLYDAKADVTLAEEDEVLVVHASAPPLSRIVRRHLGGITSSDSPPLPSLMTLPGVRDLLDDLVLTALHTSASRKHLEAPPARLPTQDQQKII